MEIFFMKKVNIFSVHIFRYKLHLKIYIKYCTDENTIRKDSVRHTFSLSRIKIKDCHGVKV